MKIVRTNKELNDITSGWTTADIINDYVKGSDHFHITYKGETILFQNDDIVNVANCAYQYNGIGWTDLTSFKSSQVDMGYYKFFKAGTERLDKEAFDYQQETGWNKSYVDAGTCDAWVVYRNLYDLPLYLHTDVIRQEKMKTIQWENRENILKSLQENNNEALQKYIRKGMHELSNPFKLQLFLEAISLKSSETIEEIFMRVVKEDIKKPQQNNPGTEKIEKFVNALKSSSNIYINTVDIECRNALYKPEAKIINVIKDLSPEAIIKPLTVQMAHGIIHQNVSDYCSLTRTSYDIHAELVSYVVNNRFGIKTNELTNMDSSKFFELKEWLSDRTEGNLIKDFDIIRKVSNQIISRIESVMQEENSINLVSDQNNYQNNNVNQILTNPKLNEEENFLLSIYKEYFKVSDPLIENNEVFFDIFKSYREDGTVQFEVKYNPLASGNNAFMYVNTLSNEYKGFSTFDDVKRYMTDAYIKNFETIDKNVKNIKLIMDQLPTDFLYDKKLFNIMLYHFDSSPVIPLSDFCKKVNQYVIEEMKQAILVDLKKHGLKPVDCLVKKMLDLNKVTKTINTINDIKTLSLKPNQDTKELLKDINKVIQYQMNQKLEFQM